MFPLSYIKKYGLTSVYLVIGLFVTVGLHHDGRIPTRGVY